MFRQHPSTQLSSESDALDEHVPSKALVEDDFLAMERQSIVRAAVDLLGMPCRQLITTLFYVEPRPAYSEIAREFALPEGSVGPTRARCLEKLMNILGKMGVSEA